MDKKSVEETIHPLMLSHGCYSSMTNNKYLYLVVDFMFKILKISLVWKTFRTFRTFFVQRRILFKT